MELARRKTDWGELWWQGSNTRNNFFSALWNDKRANEISSLKGFSSFCIYTFKNLQKHFANNTVELSVWVFAGCLFFFASLKKLHLFAQTKFKLFIHEYNTFLFKFVSFSIKLQIEKGFVDTKVDEENVPKYCIEEDNVWWILFVVFHQEKQNKRAKYTRDKLYCWLKCWHGIALKPSEK